MFIRFQQPTLIFVVCVYAIDIYSFEGLVRIAIILVIIR